MNEHLNYEGCMALLRDFNTPSHVIGHCQAVAKVAVRVGEALNKNGFNLNLKLILASAMLHDMARVFPEHHQVAATYLEKKGYKEEAEIVKAHMHYASFSPAGESTEMDLVCLGDRVCKEDAYVGLEERMDYILNKAKGNEEAQQVILKKKKEVAEYIRELEGIMDITLDALMKG